MTRWRRWSCLSAETTGVRDRRDVIVSALRWAIAAPSPRRRARYIGDDGRARACAAAAVFARPRAKTVARVRARVSRRPKYTYPAYRYYTCMRTRGGPGRSRFSPGPTAAAGRDGGATGGDGWRWRVGGHTSSDGGDPAARFYRPRAPSLDVLAVRSPGPLPRRNTNIKI